jgi:hypothetical protein
MMDVHPGRFQMSDGRHDGGSTPHNARADGADLRGPTVVAAALGLAAGALGTAAVVAAPRIKRWWTAQAAPTVQALGRRVMRQDDPTGSAPADASVILTRSTLRSFSRRVDVALASPSPSVGSGSPWRVELDLIDLLLAASIIADRMRTRSDDDVEADAHAPQLSAAMDRLASPAVVDAVNRGLSADGFPLDADTRATIARVFDGGYVEAGRYVEVRLERVAGALRITRSAIPIPHRADGATGSTDGEARHRR